MTIYYGEDAIEQVEKREGPLTEAQKRLVVLEGFSDDAYLDDKLIRTTGVGQTQGASDLSFKEVWARFEGQLENEVPGYRALPPVLQSSLMNLHYRGDLLDTNWLNLFNAGKYDEAARELLNHEEFTDLIAAGATSDSNSIVRRISAAANNIKGFGTNSITPATGRAGGVAAMSPPQTRNSILAKLEQALINADRAGRTEDARILAAELQRAMGGGQAIGGGQADISALRAEIQAQLRRSSAEESGFIGNIFSGFGAGVVNTGEMAALGGAALLEEESELAARDKIQSAANYLRPEGGDQDALTYTIASGLGSVVGTLGAAAAATYGAGALGIGALGAGIAGLGAAGAVGIGAGAGEASERARAADATEEERNAATLRGAAIGTLEIIPLGKILKIPGATKLMDKIGGKAVEEGGSKIRSALTTGGVEAAQEAAAAFLQNMNERGYNPEKELLDADIIDEAIAGGGAGVIIQGVVDFFVKGRAVRRSATESSSDVEEDVEEVTLPEVDQPRLEEGQVQGELFPSRVANTVEQDTDYGSALTDFTDEQVIAAVDKLRAANVDPATITEDMVFDTITDTPEIMALAPTAETTAETTAEPEDGGVAEDIDVVSNLEAVRDDRTPDMISRMESEVLNEMEQRELNDAEIAEIEAYLKANEEAVLDLEEVRGASQQETDTAAQKDEARADRTRPREAALDAVIGEPTTGSYVNLERKFTKELERRNITSGERAKPTKQEAARIRRAADAFAGMRPQEPAPPEVGPPIETAPEAAQLAEMEARIPERTQKPVTPSQMSFPGMGRKKTPPVEEAPPAPNTITKEFMDDLGIAPKAPIRKRAEGKDLNDPTIREQFVAFANNSKVPEQTRLNVARKLEGVPEAQLELFQPKSRKRASAKGDTNAATRTTTRTTQPTPSGDSIPVSGSPVGTPRTDTTDTTAQPNTEMPKPPRGRGVASVGSGVSDPVRGKEAQQRALDSPEPIAVPEEEKPKRKTKKKATAKKATTPKQVDTKDSAGNKKKTTAKKKKKTTAKKKKKTTATTRKTEAEQAEPAIQFAEQTSQEFTKTVGEERTTPDDKLKILTLLTNGARARDKLGNAVITYLGKLRRPSDGLYMAIYDVAHSTPQFRSTDDMPQAQVDFFKGMGRKPAQRVLDWAKANLSAETNKWIDETLAKERRERHRIESTDYVEVLGQRNAKLDARDRAEYAQFAAGMEQDVDATLKELSRLYEKQLARGSVIALDMSLHPGVRGLLRGAGNPALAPTSSFFLKQALSLLAATTPDKHIAHMAGKLADVVGDTKVEVVKDLKDAGSFDPTTNTIKLDSEIGLIPHTLLHEMGHAATSATLANKSHPMTRQLTKLFEDVKDYLDTAYGAKDVDEFTAEAMSNPEFRAKLAAINPNGTEVNALQRFNNIVGNFLRKLFGMQPKKIESAQTVADRLIEGILAPAPKFRNANELAMESTAKGVKKVMKGIDATQKAVHQPLTDKFRSDWANGMFDTLSRLGEKLTVIKLKLVDSLALSDIAKRADTELGELALEFHELMELRRGSMAAANKYVREQVKVVDKWVASSTKEKRKNLDNLIYSQEYGATLYQVDPTKPRSTYKGKTDKSGNSLEKVWDLQRRDWDALGTDGQKVYRTMRDMYRNLYGKLKDAINGRIDEALRENPDAAAKLKKEVFAKLFDSNTLDVYFPLLREGRYKLEFQYEDHAVTSDNDQYVFQMFDSKRQRDRVLAELKKDPNVKAETVKGMDGDFKTSDFNNAPPSSFVKQVLDSLNANNVGSEVQSEIMRLFIDTLPESSFAKSLKKRGNTPGYMQDAVYAMKSKGYDLASQVEQLKYNALIQSMEVRLTDLEVPDYKGASAWIGGLGAGKDFQFNTIREEIKIRMNFAKYGAGMKKIERYVRTFNQLAFVGTIGFNAASAMVQLAQTPMFTYPMLGARYGYKKTYNEIMHATSFVTGARGYGETKLDKIAMAHGLDAYYDITDNGDFVVKKEKDIPAERIKELERIAPLVRLASERGHLNRSFIFDALGLQEGGKVRKTDTLARKASVGIDIGTGISAMMFNQAERFNRQVTMVAAYNLALDRISTDNPKMPMAERQNLAAQEALYDTQEYNGGSTLETAPRIAQEHILRVAAMYKTYGLRMYYTMFKTARDALSLQTDPEVRKIAAKQLIGIHLSSLFFAGIHGIPLYGAVQLIADLFLLDDDEDDTNTIVRNFVEEGWYKGAFNQILDEAGIGADVASRIRLSGLIFQENRYNPDPSAEEFIGYYLGGPAASVFKRIGRGGMDIIYNGEMQRGIESILPAGISNMYKALGRYQQDGGIYSRRGDPIYDDMTGGELVTQFLGFAPAEYIRIQEENQRARGIDRSISEQRSNLTKKIYIAARQADFGETARIEGDVLKFNAKHPSFELSIDSIMDSLKGHMKTTENMHYGITLSPGMRRAAEEHLYGVNNHFTPIKRYNKK